MSHICRCTRVEWLKGVQDVASADIAQGERVNSDVNITKETYQAASATPAFSTGFRVEDVPLQMR